MRCAKPHESTKRKIISHIQKLLPAHNLIELIIVNGFFVNDVFYRENGPHLENSVGVSESIQLNRSHWKPFYMMNCVGNSIELILIFSATVDCVECQQLSECEYTTCC